MYSIIQERKMVTMMTKKKKLLESDCASLRMSCVEGKLSNVE